MNPSSSYILQKQNSYAESFKLNKLHYHFEILFDLYYSHDGQGYPHRFGHGGEGNKVTEEVSQITKNFVKERVKIAILSFIW